MRCAHASTLSCLSVNGGKPSVELNTAMRILSRWPLALGLAALLLLPSGSALAEARFSFDATPGKLPKDVVPSRYRVRIVPGAGNERFEGRAEIEIEVRKPVASIILNA